MLVTLRSGGRRGGGGVRRGSVVDPEHWGAHTSKGLSSLHLETTHPRPSCSSHLRFWYQIGSNPRPYQGLYIL